MDEAVITDLKRFITATISQQFADVATKDDLKGLATKDDVNAVATGLARVEQKLDDVQASIADALSASNDAVDDQLSDHEQRITKLEHHSV